METELSNIVSVLGNYNDIPTELTSETVVVSMIDGLTITKTADKVNWADGVLTYTVVIKNETEKSFTTPVITDILNPTLVTFVSDSVTVDGTKIETSKYTYEASSGTLTINLDDIAASGSSTITFQVTKKA